MMWPGVDRNTAHPWPAGRNLHLTVTVGDGERKVIVEGGRKSLRQGRRNQEWTRERRMGQGDIYEDTIRKT